MGKLFTISGTWLVSLLAAGICTADARSAAPPPRPLTLDAVISGWAKCDDALRSMHTRFTRTEFNRAFRERSVTTGEVRLLKPDLLRIDQSTSLGRQTVLFTKERIRVYGPTDKTERIFPIPADTSFLGEKTPCRSFGDSWRDFLNGVMFGEAYQQQIYWPYGGLPVRDLARRFHLRLAKEDAWYVYVEIESRQGVHPIKRMRVVLHKDTFRVRQIWCGDYNHEAIIDFEEFEANPKLTSEGIREGLPKDWKRLRYPKAD